MDQSSPGSMAPRGAREVLDKSKINRVTKNPARYTMLTAAASTVASGGNVPPVHQQVDEGINKLLQPHNERSLFSLQTKEILSHAATRMSLEVIILSDISQTQRDKCGVISTSLRGQEQSDP